MLRHRSSHSSRKSVATLAANEIAMVDPEQVAQFKAIAGVADEDANFFLAAAGGDISKALEQFYADQADETGSVQAAGLSAPQPAAAAPAASQPGSMAAATSARGSAKNKGRAQPRGGGRIASLADMQQESDEDEDQGNEYYAGGEKSGQVVKGAPKANDHSAQVEGLFDSARAAGAEAGTSADLRQPGQARGAFSGRGRTLTGGAAQEPEQPAPQAPQPVVHTITFFANGVFTVNDGEPREVMDPANREFMQSIQRGECPRELDPQDPRQQVMVNLLRSGSEYQASAKPKYRAFSGKGQTLAGPSSLPAAPAASAAQAAAPASATASSWEGADDSKPATSLQLRLADGSRLVARFNLTQTVGDIRRFINVNRPGTGSAPLVTGHPPQPLPEDDQTIEAAGLKGSVIMQR